MRPRSPKIFLSPASRAAQTLERRTTMPETHRTATPPTPIGQSPRLGEAADSISAVRHFESLLAFETDCWDVNDALKRREGGFVVLDVRSPSLYGASHVPGAVNLPHARIIERNLETYPADTLFVVYCSGPHCNGADRAALRLARLGRPVKKMIGGIEGWKDEGLGLEA
jgi:rhodanese-related sulfurtransferase